MSLHNISVGSQKHFPIKSRNTRGFFVLWDQVLVIGDVKNLDAYQELDPIPDDYL
jgi:hypothetical protein